MDVAIGDREVLQERNGLHRALDRRVEAASKVVVLAREKHRQTLRFSKSAQRKEISQCWDLKRD